MGLLGAGLSLISGLFGQAGTTAGLLALQQSGNDLVNTNTSVSKNSLDLESRLLTSTMSASNQGSIIVAKANIYQTLLSAQAKQLEAHKTIAKAFTGIVDSINA